MFFQFTRKFGNFQTLLESRMKLRTLKWRIFRIYVLQSRKLNPVKYSLTKIAKLSRTNKTVSYYAPRVQSSFPYGMYYVSSHAMQNTANQRVKTHCIFCGTQRIVVSKNPSDLCSLLIFPPKTEHIATGNTHSTKICQEGLCIKRRLKPEF